MHRFGLSGRCACIVSCLPGCRAASGVSGAIGLVSALRLCPAVRAVLVASKAPIGLLGPIYQTLRTSSAILRARSRASNGMA
jgi:hypothetical protein